MGFSKIDLKSRLKKGLMASSFGFSVNLLTQLSTVPALLFFWGAELYGEWLILSAIPAYISFSNMGFSDAMSTEMTIQSGDRNYERAQSIFESAWKVVTLMSIFAASVIVLGVLSNPSVGSVFGVSILANSDVVLIVALFSLYILLGIQFSIIGGGYRCVGHYPAHTLIVSLSKLIELLAGLLTISLGYGPVALVACYVTVRLFFLIFMVFNVRRFNKWIAISLSRIDFRSIRVIIKPSLSSAGYVFGNSVVNQGVVLSIGYFLGAGAVASYFVMRSLARILLKFAGILNSNYMPEMSAAFGAKDIDLFRGLNRQLSRYTLWMVIAAVFFLGIFGESVLSLWTFDKVNIESFIFYFVILEAATYFLGYTGSVPIVAINKHSTFVIIYTVFAVLSLGVSWVFLPLLGLLAIPLLFSVGNVMVGIFVLTSVMKISDDKLYSYISHCFFLRRKLSKIT